MRPPGFWTNSPSNPGVAARILSPLAALYAAGTARRLSRGTAEKLDVPVICVGNLNAGGTGKTPTTMAIAQKLQALGKSPAIVTRGYGGTFSGPVEVDPARHSADETGDEPLLLAAFAPVWVSKDRALGASHAVAAGANAIILDDGFQNPAIHKNLSLVVVDAVQGFGNGRVIPAGPLREPVETGLGRADYVLSIGAPEDQHGFDAHWGHQIPCPILRGELQPLAMGMPWKGLRVFAFAGIGIPEKFFRTLRNEGVDVVKTAALSDHQTLTPTLLARLERDAKAEGLQMVTTEKDAVRLPEAYRGKVLTMPVRLHISEAEILDDALARLFGD